MNDLVVVTGTSLRERVSEEAIGKLSPYLARAKEAAAVTEFDAPVFLKQMVDGLMLAGTMLAQVTYQMSRAKNDRKRAEAICALEKFKPFAEANGVKDTEKMRESFVLLQPEVIAAQDEEAYWEALYVYMQTVRQGIVQSHDDVKRSVYARLDMNNIKGPALS